MNENSPINLNDSKSLNLKIPESAITLKHPSFTKPEPLIFNLNSNKILNNTTNNIVLTNNSPIFNIIKDEDFILNSFKTNKSRPFVFKKNLLPFRFTKIIYLIKMFSEKLKYRLFYKNYNNLNDNHLNVIDDWAIPEHNIIIQRKNINKYEKITKKIILLKNSVVEILTNCINKSELLFPTISANNNFIAFWELLIFINSFYVILKAPFELSFNVHLDVIYGIYHNYEIIILILFILDIFLKFHKGYYENGSQKLTKIAIFKHYLINGFLFDILSLIGMLFSIKSINSQFQLLVLCKFYFIDEYLNLFEEKLNLNDFSDSILHIFKLFISILYIAHFLACLFHSLSFYNEIQEKSWLKSLGLQDETFQIKYIYSLYWAITTLTTVGYGDITPKNIYETMFCICVMIIGCGIFAYCINSFGYLFGRMMKKRNQYRIDLKVLNGLMQKKNLSSELQNKVRNYFYCISKEENKEELIKENELFKKLSKDLQNEIILNSNAHILKKSKLFCNTFSEDFLQNICFKMKRQNYAPEEILFEQDSEADPCIYFIIKGRIKCCMRNLKRENDEINLFNYEKDENLGEYNFISNQRFSYSAKSIGYSSVYIINRKEFLLVLEKFPEDKEKFNMIKDKILCEKELNFIYNKCKFCNSSEHLSENCEFIIIQIDKNKVIYNYLKNYNQKQELRALHQRKLNKTKRLKILEKNYYKSFNIDETPISIKRVKSNVQQEDLLKKHEKSIENFETKLKDYNLNNFSGEYIFCSENEKFENFGINFNSNEEFPSMTDKDYQTKLRNRLEKLIENDLSFNTDTKKNYEKIENDNNELFRYEFDRYKNYLHYFPYNNFNNVLKKITPDGLNKRIPTFVGNKRNKKKISIAKRKNIFKFNEEKLKNPRNLSVKKK